MNTKPNDIPELIAKWKTIAEFSADVGCGYEAARQMRRRGQIAPEHWPAVVQASQVRGIEGVTFEWLASQRGAKAQMAAQ